MRTNRSKVVKANHTIGRNVTAKRQEQGWSAHTLSQKCGLTAQTIYNIEARTQPTVRLTSIVKLAEAFGCGVDTLLANDTENVIVGMTPKAHRVLTDGMLATGSTTVSEYITNWRD